MRPDIQYDVPSTAETMSYFFLNILFFSILTWYFDHIDNSNRGKTYSKLFCLNRGIKKKLTNFDSEIRETEINQLNDDISEHQQRLIEKTFSNKNSNSIIFSLIY